MKEKFLADIEGGKVCTITGEFLLMHEKSVITGFRWKPEIRSTKLSRDSGPE